MIKKLITLFLAVLSLFVLVSCDNNNIAKESEIPDVTINSGTVVNNENKTQDEILALIDNETDSYDLITQSYDFDLLFDFSFSGSLEEVNKVAKIECIRKVDDLVYTIHRVNEGGKLLLFYEFNKESDSWIAYDSWWFFKPLHKEDFSKVEVDKTTADDIFEIDPATIVFPFGDGDRSFHILQDYSVITIWYDCDDHDSYNKVRKIECDAIPENWPYRKILDIDWPT